jgi:BTB/POZ domain
MKQSNRVWGPVKWTKLPHTVSQYGVYGGCNLSIDIYLELPPKTPPDVQTVLNNFSKMFDLAFMCDVHFVVQGETIGAHFNILASASPVLAAMFEPGKFKEGSSKTAHINDTEPEVFRQMLRYLYTGKVLRMNELAVPLLQAADYYLIDSLKKKCENYLGSELTLGNLFQSLRVAEKCSASELLESSFEYLRRHKEEIVHLSEWTQLSNEDPELFNLATQRMCSKKRKLHETGLYIHITHEPDHLPWHETNWTAPAIGPTDP